MQCNAISRSCLLFYVEATSSLIAILRVIRDNANDTLKQIMCFFRMTTTTRVIGKATSANQISTRIQKMEGVDEPPIRD